MQDHLAEKIKEINNINENSSLILESFNNAKSEIVSINNDLEKSKQSNSSLVNQIEQIQNEFSILNSLFDKIKSENQELRSNKVKELEMQRLINNYKLSESKIKEYKEQNIKLKSDKEKLNKTYENLLTEIKGINLIVIKLKSDLDSVYLTKEKVEQELKERNIIIKYILTDLDQYIKSLPEQDTTGYTGIEANSSFEEAQLSNKIKFLKNMLNNFNNKMNIEISKNCFSNSEIENQNLSINQLNKRIESIKEDLMISEEKSKSLASDIITYTSENQILKQTIVSLQEANSSSNNQESENLKDKLAKLIEMLEKTKSYYEQALEKNKIKLKEMKGTITSLENEKNLLKEEESNKNNLLNCNSKENNNMKETIIILNKTISEYKELEKQIDSLLFNNKNKLENIKYESLKNQDKIKCLDKLIQK